MKKILISFLFFISTICNGADIIINKIIFNGLKRVSSDTALFNLPLQIGKVFNENDITNSINTLFATGYFEEITIINQEKGVIVIQVKERPIINNIDFCGNKKIKNDTIQRVLDLKKIKSGNPYNDYIIFETERELKDLYHNLGKFNVIVNVIITPLSRNRIDLKIIFTEGKTAKIQHINISGNHAFRTKKLLSQFKLYKNTKWWNIRPPREYQKQKLFYDLENLRDFYLERGYAKFNINSAQIKLTPDKNNVSLQLDITEGTQYSFDTVILYGNVENHFPNIKELIHIVPQKLYKNSTIQEIKNNIQYMLGKYGYIQPIILITPDINENNKKIKLYIYIDVGPRFYIHEIYFEGNNATHDSIIRNAILQIEHTPINYVNIFKDQDRLKNISYFKNVNTRIESTNIFNQVNIIYTIEERNTGTLTLNAGIGTESNLNAQFRIAQENILGTGNSISITGTKSKYQTYIEISASQPYYTAFASNISEKIFYNNFQSNNVNFSSYDLQNYGIDINYLYPFTKYNTLNLGLNYVSNHLNKITPQVAIWRYLHSIGIYPKMIINNLDNNVHFITNDFLLIIGWMFNNLNHIYFPESGLRVNLLSKLTLPGSKNQYYKITANSDRYISLNRNGNWVLMTSVNIGYTSGIHKQENPFYDNFYAGGIDTIRGFQLNSIGPKAAYYCCNYSDKNYETCKIKSSQNFIGGNAIALIRTELIVPIIYSNEQYYNTTRLALFLDAGTVWDSFWKNTQMTRAAGISDYSISNNIRVSGGISLKWISPLGPTIFSYAKLLKKYPGDIEESFQFSIGKTW